jgi:hypothetical protein
MAQPLIISQFKKDAINCAIQDQPQIPFPLPVASAGVNHIPHLSLLMLKRLLPLQRTDELYSAAVPESAKFPLRVPRPAGLVLEPMPEGEIPTAAQCIVLVQWVGITTRTLVNFRYGDQGLSIDHNDATAILKSIGILPEGGLASLTTAGQGVRLEFAKQAECALAVLSRFARSASVVINAIAQDPDLAGTDAKLAKYQSMYFFPDLRHHNEAHYPPHLFVPGPIVAIAEPPNPFVTAALAEIRTKHQEQGGYAANLAALTQKVSEQLPAIRAAVAAMQSGGAPAATDGPPAKRAKTDDTTHHPVATPVGWGGAAPSLDLPAPRGTGKQILLRKPSTLSDVNSHPALVRSIAAVAAGGDKEIMTPTKVHSLLRSSDYSQSHTIVEGAEGGLKLKPSSSSRRPTRDTDVYEIAYAYIAAFQQALTTDPTAIVDRFRTTLLPDITRIISLHSVPVAIEYMAHIINLVGNNLRSPAYVGPKLIGVDFEWDEAVLNRAKARATTRRNDHDDDIKKRLQQQAATTRALAASFGAAAQGAKTSPIKSPKIESFVDKAARPVPKPKAGATAPTFTVTDAVRESLCTNNARGFACAFAPCPFTH